MTKWIYISAFFSFICSVSFAQKPIFDDIVSLQNINELDTNDIKFKIVQYEAAKQNLQTDLQISHAKQIISYFNHKNEIAGEIQYLNELEELLQSEEQIDDLNIIRLRLSDIYDNGGMHDISRAYLFKMIAFSTAYPFELHQRIASSFLQSNKLDSALIYLNKNLNQTPKDNLVQRLTTLQEIADANTNTKNFEAALNTYQEIENLVHRSHLNKELHTLYNNIGYIHNNLNDYNTALKYFRNSEKMASKSKPENLSQIQMNIAITYKNLGDYPNSIKYLLKAKENLQTNHSLAPKVNFLLAKAQYKSGDIYRAESSIMETINLAKANQSDEILEDAYLTSALLQVDLIDYEKALSFYSLHLNIRDSLDQINNQNLEAALNTKTKLQEAQNEIELLEINQILNEVSINKLKLETETLTLTNQAKTREILIVKREQEIQEEKIRVQQLEALKYANELEIAQERINVETEKSKFYALELAKNNELDSISREQVQLEMEKQKLAQETKSLEAQNQINELEIARKQDQITRQATFQKYTYILGALVSFSFWTWLI